ncbi:MAG: VWA domain-containing protein [Saprospiraceae bacterium]
MKNYFLITLFSLATFFSGQAQNANSFTIKGIIVDETQSPIVSASIMEEGTNKGTLTDFDGRFTIAVSDSCVNLIVSYVGYLSERMPACHGKKELLIQLQAAEVLEEIMVIEADESPMMSKEDQLSGRAAGTKAKRRPKLALFRSNNATMSQAPAPYSPGVMPYSDAGIQHNTEDYDLIQENRFLKVQNEPLSTFSIDVDAASYSNMRRFINNGSLPPKDAVRIEEMVNYFNYDYPAPDSEHPFSVSTELSDCPWNPEHQLLHIGLQGKKIPTDNLPASNLVFLIDVSGSMSAANKLPLLKSSFKLLTDQMRPQDKVTMVVYAGSSGVVLKPTAGNDKRKIMEAFQKLQAGGSTAGGAGIKLAYKLARENFVEDGNNRVILATDGDFNVGQSSDADLVRMIEEERKSGVFLTVLGFGMGNYKDNKMQQLAKHGNGNHAYIDNIEEARKVLVTEFGGTMFTIAKDVKLQLEFNPAYVAGYRLIGYENRMLANEDFNDDKKDAGEMGSGHTVTAIYEIIPQGTKSSLLTAVDDLKYQEEAKPIKKGSKNNELMTVKLRYKQPDGATSTKLEHVQKAKPQELAKTSDNFRWSAAVAEFGLLLRKSEFKGKSTFANVLELANGAKGKDEEGYRHEFIRMVKSVRDLSEPMTAEK